MLELNGLVKRFGDIVALDGCSFAASPARMLGFLGPNGAGKTTAMRAVFGLVRLDSGMVKWKGVPIKEGMKQSFGYMPEQRGLYPRMKVHDQLVYIGELHGMSARSAGASADRWLEEFGLSDRRLDRIEELSHTAISSAFSWLPRLSSIPSCWCSTNRLVAWIRSEYRLSGRH